MHPVPGRISLRPGHWRAQARPSCTTGLGRAGSYRCAGEAKKGASEVAVGMNVGES